MKKLMIDLLVKLMLSLLTKLLGYNPVQRIVELEENAKNAISIPKPVADILDQTKILCVELSTQSQSGEYKRHQVLSKLIKLGVSERDAGLAIEKAIRDLSGT